MNIELGALQIALIDCMKAISNMSKVKQYHYITEVVILLDWFSNSLKDRLEDLKKVG